ncbi:MAG TPA: hypothetical protein VET86_06225 [Casimicrobiaceae bacterium]|nr:hypothetical protein [Casimicrobiaceae bacterium]
MRLAIVTLVGLVPVLAYGAAPVPEGRWEGVVRIPGRTQRLVVDLQPAHGSWSGSIILPGLGVKGDALTGITINGSDVTFVAGHALGSPTQKPPSFDAHLDSADAMTGRMHQGGNDAPFTLARTGPAQVEALVRSAPVGRALLGEWSGEFELGGYPRRVTITIANRADAATAEFLIVGKQRNVLPVELVVQDGAFVRIESPATRINFEGRLAESGDELRGVVELGPTELPLALRRAPGSAS